MLTFLASAAFWGVLLLAIPIIIHLFRPRKMRATPFSSLRWLRDTRQRLSRRIQWHQLWLMPSQGGDPFPLSYGDFDNTNPRWSPDGKQIAFISNRSGNTSLWVLNALGGAQRQVVAKDKHYLKPMGHLSITVLDPSGKPTPARVSVTGEEAGWAIGP